jgi:hypothetical protein
MSHQTDAFQAPQQVDKARSPHIYKSSLTVRGEQGILQSPAILKADANQMAGNHVYGKKFASAFGGDGDKSLHRFACPRVLSREECVDGPGWV